MAGKWRRSATLCADALVLSSEEPKLRRALSPGFRSRIGRLLWGLVWLLLYRPSPVPLHFWRRFLLRCFGATIGKGAHPYPTARVWAPWNLTMHDRSCLGPGVDCYSAASVVLHTDCIVSQRAYLCAASHDVRDPAFPLVIGDITIEEGAWVATEAFVGPGVTIARRAVVGARAVVTRNVPAETVVAGNPAKAIARRS